MSLQEIKNQADLQIELKKLLDQHEHFVNQMNYAKQKVEELTLQIKEHQLYVNNATNDEKTKVDSIETNIKNINKINNILEKEIEQDPKELGEK